MKPIQILMPMGGLGQRFRDEGYDKPKPLIEVDGTAMFLKALGSFDAYPGEKRHLFVVRQDAEDNYGLATDIKKLQPDAQISMLQKDTRGAVETSLLARGYIEQDLPLVIMDCDFSFASAEYFKKVAELAEHGAYDGVLLSFDSDWDRYSYARTNKAGEVVETAEKKVISHNALAGAYCFGSGKLFIEAADKLMLQPLGEEIKEYYISLLYNLLLAAGKKIALARVDRFNSFGTPQELKHYMESL